MESSSPYLGTACTLQRGIVFDEFFDRSGTIYRGRTFKRPFRPRRPLLSAKRSRSLRGLLHQAVFVMQAPEHGRLFNAMTGWQLVPMVAERNALLDGFRQART